MRIETTVGNAGAPAPMHKHKHKRVLCRVEPIQSLEPIQPIQPLEARSQPVTAAGSDLPRSPFAPGLAIPVPVQWGAVRR